MNTEAWAIFRVLAETFHPGRSLELLEFLPKSLQEAAKEQTSSVHAMTSQLIRPEDFLDRMDTSWIAVAIQREQGSMQAGFLSCLSGKKRQRVAKLTSLDTGVQKKAQAPRRFLKSLLYQVVCEGKERRPPSLLPAGELKPLVTMTKRQVVSVIRLAGLQELAPEFQYTLDQKVLDTLAGELSDVERSYVLGEVRERKLQPPLERLFPALAKEPGRLGHLLQRRGLRVLAVALEGEDPDLIWYLRHILDQGRAKTLDNFASEVETNDKAKSAAVVQICRCLQYLKDKSAM